MNSEYQLTDDSIAAIVSVIQFGFVAGRDVTDLFRNMKFNTTDSGKLDVTAEWLETFNREMEEANEQVLKNVSGAGKGSGIILS